MLKVLQDFQAVGKEIAKPRADGMVGSVLALPVSIMAPRLQGECHPDGHLDLSIWGGGHLARVRFTPLSGPFVYKPNGFTAPAGGLFVAQSAPVLVLRGAEMISLLPASPGGVMTEQRGRDLVIAAGEDRREAGRAMALDVKTIVAEDKSYAKRCDALPKADPLLRSMVMQGVHAGLSSVRKDSKGQFAGLAAGQSYSAPARTYYRDGYWTLQILLQLAPEIVLEQIDVMARGIRPDGEAPSAVILSGAPQAAAWERLRKTNSQYAKDHRRAGEWWSDHFDSPLFFVLALGDYAAHTGDETPVQRHWHLVKAVFDRYAAFAREGGGLPQKPRHDRDWADNVFRAGCVAYDLGLWVGALDVIARLGKKRDLRLAGRAREMAAKARELINGTLWQKCGWYADYMDNNGFVEDHLTLDSLTLLRYDVADDSRARSVLNAVKKNLESRHNKTQKWEDWGMLCAFPPFRRRADLRSKTAFPYRYHNGADWPWLDGVYANELLRRGLPGWRYPLTRWWQTCLEQGWTGPVEYFSPPFGRGCLLQGWSSMPAAVALAHKKRVLQGC